MIAKALKEAIAKLEDGDPHGAASILRGLLSSPKADDIQKIVDYYVSKYHPRSRGFLPGSKEWRLADQRLKRWSVSELCRAVDGCHAHPWNNGQETGRKYLGLDLILRNDSQVQRFIEFLEEEVGPQLSEKERKAKAAAEAWLQGGGDEQRGQGGVRKPSPGGGPDVRR